MSMLVIEHVGAWWLTAMGHFLWQGAVIWLMAAAAMHILRRFRSSLRYAVLCVALCAMAACVPVTLAVLPAPQMAETPSAATLPTGESVGTDAKPVGGVARSATSTEVAVTEELSQQPEGGRPGRTGQGETKVEPGEAGANTNRRSVVVKSTAAIPVAEPPRVDALQPLAESRTQSQRSSSWWLVPTVAVYVLCVAVMLGRLALGLAGGLGLRRAAQDVVDSELLKLVANRADDLGLKWTPVVAWCERVAVPTVVGVMRPMVLLPISLSTGLTSDQFATLLAHELAHIRRYDHLVNLLQRLVEAILFFHPAVWCLSRWIRLEREHCCDDLVVSLGDSPVTYAGSLLRVAELSCAGEATSSMTASVLLAATGRRSQLAHRIVRLLEGPPQPPLRLSRGAGAVLVLLPWLLLFSPLWLQIRAEPPGTTPPATAQTDSAGGAPSDPLDGEAASPGDEPVLLPQNAETKESRDGSPGVPTGAAVPQVFLWSMLVDETLADKIGDAAETELPRQAAFRVLRFDAGKLRKMLFASNAEPHVHSDVRSVQPLHVCADPTDESTLSAYLPFYVPQAASNGRLYGTYVSSPGNPFELRIREAALDIRDMVSDHSSPYQIKSQRLEFRGDVPIGQAVAFTAKAESETGKKSFHSVFVFESLPRASQQYLRIISDPAWFKAGHAKIIEALHRADEFNRLAAPMPEELPERWTKTLPHGGSVSLLAISRPQTHPFCWWDTDGQPRSTDWQLQQHAFGHVETMALICVRDPASNYEKQGIAYVPGSDVFRLRLTQPWKSLADSELYLASVDGANAGQPAQIGVNLAAGTWKELGRLKPKEEVTIGKADYLVGEPRSVGDLIHVYFGYRYLTDLEVRLRLLDRQGRFLPVSNTRASYGSSGPMTDSRGIPSDWPGFELITAKLKLEDLDQYVVESRPRHSVTLSEFPTELAPVIGQLPRLQLASAVPQATKPIADLLTEQLEEVLSEDRFQYFRELELAAIVTDFRQFTTRQTPVDISQDELRLVAAGRSRFTHLSDDYLSFFPSYRDLKWRVWLALNRRNLSVDELARREQQREELREFVKQIPQTNFVTPRTHGDAIAKLEQLFDDPWFAWFHEPMTDDEVQMMLKQRSGWNFHEPWTAPSSLSTVFFRTKKARAQNDAKFGTGPLPLDAEVVAEAASELFRFHTRFDDYQAFYGVRDLVYDDAPEPRRRLLDFNRPYVEPPGDASSDLDAIRRWAVEQKRGVMAYDAQRHVLVTLRGAKLAVLPLKHWADADRMNDKELRRIVREQSVDEIVLTDHFGERPASSGYGAGYPERPLLGIESPEGEIGIIDIESVSNNGVTAHLRSRPPGG